MVNLYDSYQQSKVMNIIPDTASKLLKAKKEQMAVDVESDKLLDDITGKMNSPYASRLDSEEKAGIMKGYLDEVNGIMSNQELDGYAKFSGISAIKRKMTGNKRIYDLDASNKVMISEIAKIDPTLREAFDATLLKDLKSPTDGTIWSGNFAMDFDKEMGNTLNRAYAGLPSEDFTLTYKDKSGKSISTLAHGVSQERIDNYIDDNADYLLNENPALKMKTIASFIKQNGRAPYSPTDFNNQGMDPSEYNWKVKADDDMLIGMFKNNFKAKLGEYANSRSITKDKGITLNNYITNNPEKPVPTIEPLSNEMDVMYASVAAKLGSTDKIGSPEFRKKLINQFSKNKMVGDNTSYFFKTKTVSATSVDYTMAVWEDGSTPVSTEFRNVINNYDNAKSDIDKILLNSSEAATSKDVIMIPKLQNTSLFAYGKVGTGPNATTDITSGSQILNHAVTQALQKASDRGSAYTSRSRLTSTYSVMADGSTGSVANITVSDKKDKATGKSTASDIFSGVNLGGQGANRSLYEHLEGLPSGQSRVSIGDGLLFVVKKEKVTKKDPATNKEETYNEYSFDVIKKAMDPTEPQYMQSVHNRAVGKPGLSTAGAGYSNSSQFGRQ